MAEGFTNLPAEVKRIILLNLPIKDIVATCRIDTPFNQLCDDEFWQLVLELHFPGVKTIPGLTNYQTISYILTPKVITIDVSGISDFLAITGDMTIGELGRILTDQFSTKFPDWYTWIVVTIDDRTLNLPISTIINLPPNTMLVSIPLSSLDDTISEGNLFTAVTKITGKYFIRRGMVVGRRIV